MNKHVYNCRTGTVGLSACACVSVRENAFMIISSHITGIPKSLFYTFWHKLVVLLCKLYKVAAYSSNMYKLGDIHS